jgi:aspartate/methionine/tyrosine aminotransferase
MIAHFKKHFLDQEIPAQFEWRGETKHYYAAGAPDVEAVREYYYRGAPHGNVLYFSIGETWNQIAPGLDRLVRSSPPSLDSHGYQLMPYGLPALRKILRQYIDESHGLPAGSYESGICETAVASMGTRTAMYDFGKLVLKRGNFKKKPVFVTTLPAWDYRGVFEPMGFTFSALPLRAEQDFRPDLNAFDTLLENIQRSGDKQVGIIAINAQHNPTAVNWTESEVRHLIRTAMNHGAAILIDDAYFAIHDPAIRPTSALRILIEELRRDFRTPPLWIGVRSLGKQFNCNGWSLGSVTASPENLIALYNEFLFQRSYPYGSYYQSVMANWLASAESTAFLAKQNVIFTSRKRAFRDFFATQLGFALTDVHIGDCTSYLLIRVPEAYRGLSDASLRFQKRIFDNTGVLFGVGSLSADPERTSNVHEYIRAFVGPSNEILGDALNRLAARADTWRTP